jgi:hypothetical protein
MLLVDEHANTKHSATYQLSLDRFRTLGEIRTSSPPAPPERRDDHRAIQTVRWYSPSSSGSGRSVKYPLPP